MADETKTGPSTTPVLTYFDGRGLAEEVRFVLAAVCGQWDERYLRTRKHFTDLMATGALTFGQVPLLQIDGKALVQTGAIVRYLARRGNLYGDNDDEAARIDLIREGATDFTRSAFVGLPFRSAAERPAALASAKAACARYLPVFSRLLRDNGEGAEYMVGKRLSLADLTLALEYVREVGEELAEDLLSEYASLEALRKRLLALPCMVAFYTAGEGASSTESTELEGKGHRHPIAGPKYVKEVGAALGRA